MPELPEVETIVRSLRHPVQWPFAKDQPLSERPGIIGRQVSSAELHWQKTLASPSADEFRAKIIGQSIRTAGRRGKFIVLSLDRNTLLIHLRMSGDLRVEKQECTLQPHDRLTLNFVDGSRLVFNDTRKFGRAWLVEDPQSVLGDLGPEPLDAALSAQHLYNRLHTSGRMIKTLLLDQTILAGIGNIYADEALHRAGIHPARTGKSISLEQTRRLLEAIREVLEEGIQRNGSSIDWVYRGGDFQNYFRVYQRTGQPCPVCGTAIERRVIGQRSTHFCPVCQRESE